MSRLVVAVITLASLCAATASHALTLPPTQGVKPIIAHGGPHSGPFPSRMPGWVPGIKLPGWLPTGKLPGLPGTRPPLPGPQGGCGPAALCVKPNPSPYPMPTLPRPPMGPL